MSDFETRVGSALRNLSERAPSAVGLEKASRARYRRRRRTQVAGVALAAAACVAAIPLSGALVAGGPSGKSPGQPADNPSASDWPNSLQPVERAAVGQQLVSDLGAITVHELQFPVTDPGGVTPSSGEEFGVLDLEVCSNGRSVGDRDRYSVNHFGLVEVWAGSGSVGPNYWHLGENRADTELRTPTLTDAQLADVAEGDCERGWVSFSLPSGAEIGRVDYRPHGITLRTWRAVP